MTTPSLRVYPLLYLPRCPTWTGAISNPYMGHIWVTPSSPNWTLDFEPAFSPRFSPTLSPRSIFHPGQRFPISNHVTSGSHEPTILFSNWSAVSPLKPRDFRFHEPAILFSNWSAVSHLKPRDFRFHEPAILFSNWSAVSHLKSRDFRLYEPTIPLLPTGQRFPTPEMI